MTVSLCVVAYNEEGFLHNLLRDISAQSYDHSLMEIVLVDSASTDKTRQIMTEYSRLKHGFRRVLVKDNPKRRQACGWNIAIGASSGDVIIRIDAHSHIPPEFVALNVKNIEDGESVSGGIRPCITEKGTAFGRCLLSLENSLFGSSINRRMGAEGKQYVKTMFHAAYKREIFSTVGGFNENLLRTEDNELHYRIRRAGFRLCLDPHIVSYQYARSTLKGMVKQKYGNGKWIGLTLGVEPRCISPLHLVPLCFVLSILATTVLWGFGYWHSGALLWSLYTAFAVYSTVASIIGDGFLPHKLLIPFLFLILHISYGVGTLIGVVEMPFRRKKLLSDGRRFFDEYSPFGKDRPRSL